MIEKRVMLVDDHPVFCRGLAQVIDEEDDLTVCRQAESIGEALSAIPNESPDIVLVDLTLKNRSGVELIGDIKANWPGICILVVSMHDEALYASRVSRAGARGYVQKDERPEIIVDAIRCLLGGGQYWNNGQREAFEELYTSKPADSHDIEAILSDREFEIFRLISQGYRPKDIAEKLHLSVHTVERHRTNMREKLNLSSSRELTQLAIEWSKNR